MISLTCYSEDGSSNFLSIEKKKIEGLRVP